MSSGSPDRGRRMASQDNGEPRRMTTSAWDPWNFRDRPTMLPEDKSLVGFKVHAVDGDIGKVDAATTDVDSSHIVVDTGPWIFGRKVMLPAGTIESIDWTEEKVYVDRSKDQIKDSPELTATDDVGPAYRDRLDVYYRGFYAGP
jgi:hypothetical protein